MYDDYSCRCSSEGREAEGAPAAPAASYEEDEYEEECIDFDPYAFIKNLPPLQQACALPPLPRELLLALPFPPGAPTAKLLASRACARVQLWG